MRRDVRHTLAPSVVLADPIPREQFKVEVREWADRLDVEPIEIHIAAMRRKWASCSTRGRVTFAKDLLAQPAEFRREVVVHELLHLKVPNHGPLFRALLSAHLAG
jgi:predicted metal-dependent hydrolase